MQVRSARRSARTISLRRVALWLTIGAVGILLVVAIAVVKRSVPPAAAEAPPFNALAKGDVAPAFSAATTQGPFSLGTARRPVFLEVFATWCPHCQRETAVLNQLYRKYRNRLDFLAVSGSQYAGDRASAESETDVLNFANHFSVRYPVAFDGSLSVAKSYLQAGFPTIVIIGADKRIAYVGSGEISMPILDSAIRAAIPQR